MWTFFNAGILWGVRKAGMPNGDVFHVQDRDEAIALCATLNGYELGCSAAWNVSEGH
jgi:hypothetical protein